MNERLKELAVQAGMEWDTHSWCWLANPPHLEKFAELVRQDEREACAKLCEVQMSLIPAQAWTVNPYTQCMKAIRARGEPNPAFKNYMGDNWAGIV
jgi:hypothetical protein